ncbi:adenosylmethionine decarboxylase [Antrihabitans stalactiti]|uniref:S-adenosylmethionine decarboxylase proenzyme n=1 Tax=Antrihabitans stalactiti TaxID=2584121 RepID=A0A848KBG5_9NOCA|nr:adenosylmethionine decarboxylase [Antrihabitans stalactiti]NMN94514.1 adenosylmethionine decarboxylase [Antrihabitans stalactiti]
MNSDKAFAGHHVLAELRGVDSKRLDDAPFLQEALSKSLTAAGATVCDLIAHQFEPQGVTVLALLAESHASIHTYPELGSAFVDVFTCGASADPQHAARLLADALGAESVATRVVERGPAQVRTVTESVGTGLTRSWNLTDVLFEADTDFQHVVIGRTAQGISLFCDDERQSTDATQLIYHEALMVPALLLAEQVRRVLIIGSSEGVASQIAVAAGAERVDHVDIDKQAVQACAEYLPYGYSPADLDATDGPTRIHYRDGFEFIAEAAAAGDRYDVVVIDLPDENDDPAAQHNRLYGKEFLQRSAEILSEGGVLACQAGCPTVWRNDTLRKAWERFNETFGTVAYYGSDEHEWAFLFARVDVVADPTDRMISRLSTATYRPATVDPLALRGGSVPPHSLR